MSPLQVTGALKKYAVYTGTFCLSLRKIAFVILALSFSLPAQSGKGFRELGDEELCALRGRFAPGNELNVFFGIKMESRWHSSDGALYQGGLSFTLTDNGPIPTTELMVYRKITSASSEASESVDSPVSGVGGLAQADGVVQSNQVAGTGNSALNSIYLRVSDNPQDTGDFTQNQGAVSLSSADEAIRISTEPSQFGVQISTPAGVARQGFFGDQLTQSISISGAHNRVSQHLAIGMVTGGLQIHNNVSVHNAIGEALRMR